jgi:hypothetical protein
MALILTLIFFCVLAVVAGCSICRPMAAWISTGPRAGNVLDSTTPRRCKALLNATRRMKSTCGSGLS